LKQLNFIFGLLIIANGWIQADVDIFALVEGVLADGYQGVGIFIRIFLRLMVK
jgi:hypothetical protein